MSRLVPDWQIVERLIDEDMLNRARRDAKWHMKLEVPEPKDFANELPLDATDALSRIYRNGQHGWQAREKDVELLRHYSLVEARGRGVSAFGLKVYRAVKEGE